MVTGNEGWGCGGDQRDLNERPMVRAHHLGLKRMCSFK